MSLARYINGTGNLNVRCQIFSHAAGSSCLHTANRSDANSERNDTEKPYHICTLKKRLFLDSSSLIQRVDFKRIVEIVLERGNC